MSLKKIVSFTFWYLQNLAGLTGLEPVNAGIKILCLTTLAIAHYNAVRWIRTIGPRRVTTLAGLHHRPLGHHRKFLFFTERG